MVQRMSYLFMHDMPWLGSACQASRWGRSPMKTIKHLGGTHPKLPSVPCASVSFLHLPLPSSSLCLWRMIIHWMRGVTAWQGRASSAVITIAGHRQSTASWQLKTTTDVKGTFQRHTQRCCPPGFNRNLTQTHTQTRRLSLKVRAWALTPNQQFQWRMGTPCSGGKHTAYSS